MLMSILALFAASFALGFPILMLYKDRDLEAALMSFGFGFCAYPILGILLGFGSLINLSVVIVISGIILLFYGLKYRDKVIISGKIDLYIVGVVIISSIVFGVFLKGGMDQVWLEDGDPNGHAVAAAYISHYSTFLKPNDMYIARYMEPYPVGFQMWTGLLIQDGYDVAFTLMWFTYFAICVGFIFFYYFAKDFMGSRAFAFTATFLLACLPTFSSRFIFSQAFAITQVIVALYFLSKMTKNKRLWIAASVVLGSLMLTHPTTSVVMAVFMGMWIIVESAKDRKISWGLIKAGVGGILVALPWWGFELMKYGWYKMKYQMNLIKLSEGILGFSDPTMKFYTLRNFIEVPLENTIDNMTGIGVGIFVLMVFGIYAALANREKWRLVALVWLVFGVVAVFSNYLPVSFIPTRMWVYMSIPLALIAAVPLRNMFKGGDTSKVIALMLIALVLFTSAYPKAFVNLELWGNARFNSFPEYNLLMYLVTLDDGTKVIDPCMYERVWGLNLWDDPLDKESLIYRNAEVNTSEFGWDAEGWLQLQYPENSTIFNNPLNETYEFLKSKDYEYIIVGSKCFKHQMLFWNEFDEKVDEMDKSPLFNKTMSFQGENVFKIK